MGIQTFSGAHPFRPQCLIAAFVAESDDEASAEEAPARVADLLETVGEGRCLRCGVEFAEGEIPSGSRVTACRCIPICRVCSEAEAYAPDAAERINGPEDAVLLGLLAPIAEWPVPLERVAEAVMEYRGRYLGVGMVGVGEIQDKRGSGGWLEFGFDESSDAEERMGRGEASGGSTP